MLQAPVLEPLLPRRAINAAPAASVWAFSVSSNPSAPALYRRQRGSLTIAAGCLAGCLCRPRAASAHVAPRVTALLRIIASAPDAVTGRAVLCLAVAEHQGLLRALELLLAAASVCGAASLRCGQLPTSCARTPPGYLTTLALPRPRPRRWTRLHARVRVRRATGTSSQTPWQCRT